MTSNNDLYAASRERRADAWQDEDYQAAHDFAVEGFDLAGSNVERAESARDIGAALIRGATASSDLFPDIDTAIEVSTQMTDQAITLNEDGALRARAATFDWVSRYNTQKAYGETNTVKARKFGRQAVIFARKADEDFVVDAHQADGMDWGKPDQMRVNLLGAKSFIEARYGNPARALIDAVRQIRYGRHSEDSRFVRNVNDTKTPEQVNEIQRRHILRGAAGIFNIGLELASRATLRKVSPLEKVTKKLAHIARIA